MGNKKAKRANALAAAALKQQAADAEAMRAESARQADALIAQQREQHAATLARQQEADALLRRQNDLALPTHFIDDPKVAKKRLGRSGFGLSSSRALDPYRLTA